MTSRIVALRFGANDPHGLARFWSALLGWDLADLADLGADAMVAPGDGGAIPLRFAAVTGPKLGKKVREIAYNYSSIQPASE